MTKKPSKPKAPYKSTAHERLKIEDMVMNSPNANYGTGVGALGKELGPKYNYFGKRITTKKEQRLGKKK